VKMDGGGRSSVGREGTRKPTVGGDEGDGEEWCARVPVPQWLAAKGPWRVMCACAVTSVYSSALEETSYSRSLLFL